jgi:hypothetical protein
MKIMKMASVWRKRQLKSGVSAYQMAAAMAKINNGGNGAGNNGGVMACENNNLCEKISNNQRQWR